MTKDIIRAAQNSIYKILPQMIFLLDDKERMIDCNKTAEEVFRLSPLPEYLPFHATIDSWLGLYEGEWAEIEGETFFFFFRDGRKQCYQVTKLSIPMGSASGYVVIANDVTVMHHMLETLRNQANMDALTGMPNRRAFDAMAKEIWEKGQYPFSIILGDLDQLKRINDTWGHTAGDEALCQVASLLMRHAKKGIFAARISGDEFGMLLPNTDVLGAQALIKRLEEEGKNQRLRSGHAPVVSYGCAEALGLEQALIDVFELADKNLYTQKILHHTQRDGRC